MFVAERTKRKVKWKLGEIMAKELADNEVFTQIYPSFSADITANGQKHADVGENQGQRMDLEMHGESFTCETRGRSV